MTIKLVARISGLMAIMAAVVANELDAAAGRIGDISKQYAASQPSPTGEAVRRVLSDKIKAGERRLKRAMAKIDSELSANANLGEGVQPFLSRISAMIAEAADFSGVDASRLDALQLLASLQKVWDGDMKCDHESYTILAKNNQALEGAALHQAKKFPARSRLVARMVHKVALKHAESCKLVYPNVYEKLVQQVTPSSRDKIKTFFDLLVEIRIKFSKPSSWSLFGAPSVKLQPADAVKAETIAKNIKRIGGSHDATIAYQFLRDFVREDPDQWFLTRVPVSETDNKLVLDEKAIHRLLKTHLVEPCKEYVSLLGPSVFEPAELDAKILDPVDTTGLGADLLEFQRARIRYNLCTKLVDRDESSLLRGVIAIARRAPVNAHN